jgi:hypothetical protein
LTTPLHFIEPSGTGLAARLVSTAGNSERDPTRLVGPSNGIRTR